MLHGGCYKKEKKKLSVSINYQGPNCNVTVLLIFICKATASTHEIKQQQNHAKKQYEDDTSAFILPLLFRITNFYGKTIEHENVHKFFTQSIILLHIPFFLSLLLVCISIACLTMCKIKTRCTRSEQNPLGYEKTTKKKQCLI